MSADYGSNVITIIPEEKLSELCPKTLYTFNKVMVEYNLYEEDVFFYFSGQPNFDWTGAAVVAIREAWSALEADFASKTTMPNGKHLTLKTGYHDSSNGGIYDDVSGVFFQVEDVYVKSQAGETFAEYLKDVAFVSLR